MSSINMPAPPAEIVPLLLIPPVKVVTSLIWMPLEPAAILPPLFFELRRHESLLAPGMAFSGTPEKHDTRKTHRRRSP
jgi:hypothetical protein